MLKGDLGIEMPMLEVPMVQKDLTARANRASKPVHTATEMLEVDDGERAADVGRSRGRCQRDLRWGRRNAYRDRRAAGIAEGLARPGEIAAITSGMPVGVAGANGLKIHRLPTDG